MRTGSAEIRLLDIRAHEGSQARAWEELAYQLRPSPGQGHTETRKTRAPDAGVEWYEIYADGHHEGYQAKFHANLKDALGGMRESIEAVCAKRPDLTKLTFVLPYDFTDSGDSTTKTDQDRWTEAVSRWRKDFPAADHIEFRTIRAGDITALLTLKEHVGRREYWFGGLDLSDEWFRQRFKEASEVADSRYTPEADSPSSVNLIVDAVSCGPTFMNELTVSLTRAILACKQDTGLWGDSHNSATQFIGDLELIRNSNFAINEGSINSLLPEVSNLRKIQSITTALLELADIERGKRNLHDQRIFEKAGSALLVLQNFATSEAAAALLNGAFALVGEAGQGKTHSLLRAIDGCINRGVPALAILGQRLSDKNWWPAMTDVLGGISVSSDEFLQALDSLAEARGKRALVVFDAINESQSPKRWHEELPALLTQFQQYPHLALVISYRSDYREVISAPKSLIEVRHPGFSGYEAEALEAYCELFQISIPLKNLFEPALSSPLFLRMYCEVMAANHDSDSDIPSRSNLFELYAVAIGRKVKRKLGVPPTNRVVENGVSLVADRILENQGNPVARREIEADLDELLPGRIWPNTLFQQMVSEGLIELRPSYGGDESVAFPFQAYSEHLLSNQLLRSIEHEPISGDSGLSDDLQIAKRLRILAKRVGNSPWSWRSLAVLLPEKEGLELIDLLPEKYDDLRLQEAMRESLADRTPVSFGERALQLLQHGLEPDPESSGGEVESILTLAPREGHPGNADWLHERLVSISMADRDATWSIGTFQTDQYSDAYRRLTRWADRLPHAASREEARLASIALMWLLTSPNRFLRDGASKSLVKILCNDLALATNLVEKARETDDPYIHERVLTCSYGALLVAGDRDLEGSRGLFGSVSDWLRSGLPIDVIARDSARGIAAWAADRGLIDESNLDSFSPPYYAAPPQIPPTREDLEKEFGVVKDGEGNYIEWRASSILKSCLDWYGDFNKYVMKHEVGFFSWYPLSGPQPTVSRRDDPLGRVEVNWAGRWVANRAIACGWTAERFEYFEQNHDLRRGRDNHKAERFGKKYQWIAHRELLARLADNFHPSIDSWSVARHTYHGPWVWYGRDFDPTLPPSTMSNGVKTCNFLEDQDAAWTSLRAPAMDIQMAANDWVAKVDDLPTASDMFSCVDSGGQKWVAIQRYATWDRHNSQRESLSKRERDVFFLQFSWLVPKGQGRPLYEFIQEKGLAGRWMPDRDQTLHQYLGETSSSPIVITAEIEIDEYDLPDVLIDQGIRPRPAVEHYSWEGTTLDCSIDESVGCYTPTSELLGSARWIGHRAQWQVDDRIVAKAVHYPDDANGQEVLLVDPHWLRSRLSSLNVDMVIGTLSERHALPLDDDERRMAYSDISYVAYLDPETELCNEVGPILTVRSHDDEKSKVSDKQQDFISDELFNPDSK